MHSDGECITMATLTCRLSDVTHVRALCTDTGDTALLGQEVG